jgi:hypothetical protein
MFNVGDICVPWIGYDDGTAENYNWVDGPGYRWAVRFDPGSYPFSLCAAEFAINPTAPTEYKGSVRIAIQLADGPSGTPGTVVVVDTTGSIKRDWRIAIGRCVVKCCVRQCTSFRAVLCCS